MPDLDQLLDELERLLGEVEALEEPARGSVLSLLDGIDTLHRQALGRLAAQLDLRMLEQLRAGDPSVAWLFEAYAVGVDERAAAEAAIEHVRPYLHSHGGDVAVTEARGGVVTVRLSGACSGCTASTITLRRGVEEALREHFTGFTGMEVEEDREAPAHPPPGPTLLQIESLVAPPAGGPSSP